MLMLEHSIQDCIIKRVLHWVLYKFVIRVSLAEWSGIGLSIVLDVMIPQRAGYFQRFEQSFVGVLMFHLE